MTDQRPHPDSEHTPDRWDAIARLLAGESSPAEVADVRRWLANHPTDARTVAALDALLPSGAIENRVAYSDRMTDLSSVNVEHALQRVHAQMETPAPVLELSRSTQAASQARVLQHRTGTQSAIAPRQTRTSFGFWQVGGMVAAAAVIAAFGVNAWRSSQKPAATVAITYDTKVGAQGSVMLPDSSRVILAPGSHLVVAANYGQGQRNVELRGAGQFTVRHDAKRPFSVRIGSAVIRDLGTVFSVKSIDNAGVVVSVTEGSVLLSDSSSDAGNHTLQLKAGDRGRLMADGSVSAELGIVTPDETAWVTGKLNYRDTPLAEVQADLRRWYGVELVVGDAALEHLTVTSNGNASEPVEKIIERITTMQGTTSVRRGDTVFINRAGDRLKH